jgi:predicted PurR-regulated permease PerM
LIVLSVTFVALVVFAFLYWAQVILIPVALAIFLTFVLSPAVSFLQRHGLGRLPSILIVVACTVLVFGLMIWFIARQAGNLINDLPNYSDNIKAKILTLKQKVSGPGSERLQHMLNDIARLFEHAPPPAPLAPTEPGNPGQPPTVIVTQPSGSSWLAKVPTVLGPVVEIIAQFGMALVLVIFMLLKREDLRNRLIRLGGDDRITHTTRAVDEASQRISRFLRSQAIVNSAYGVAFGFGLFLLGMKHAPLWGLMAGVLRYIPFLGTFLAAVFPITLSLAMFEGWSRPLLVIGWILTAELLTYNFVEPHLFGKSIGVSEVAQLVVAAFWGFLWGPIGLLLSGPLTVCLLVLGRYVPSLNFLEVLLGDEPALDKDISYYQRLAAKDPDEAAELIVEHLKDRSPELICDEVLLPALSQAKHDRHRDEISLEDERFMIRTTREILEDMSEHQAQGGSTERVPAAADPRQVRILACPATDEADEVALEMLQQLLPREKWDMHVAPATTLASELLGLIEEQQPAVVCIGSLPPGGRAHTRYLCKRLRRRFPRIRILVGRWDPHGSREESQASLEAAGADHVATSLHAAIEQLQSWRPVFLSDNGAAAALRGPREPART